MSKKITTLGQAAKAYGGDKAMAEAFAITVADLKMWKVRGVPTRYELGLYLGLAARGFEMSPKLLYARWRSWSDLQGVAMA